MICTSKGSFKNNVFRFNGNNLSRKNNEDILNKTVVMVKSEKTGVAVAFVLRDVGETFTEETGETIEYSYTGLAPEYSHLQMKVTWV